MSAPAVAAPTSSRYVLPAGSTAADGYDLVVTPASAGWGYSSLRVLTLPAGGSRTVVADGEELVLVPLAGAVLVELASGERAQLAGRADVFAGPTDVAYLPVGSTTELTSAAGGRFALCGARTDVVLPFHHLPAAEIPVELRGADRCSRQVRNFATPEALDAAAIIACEVITPGGNWSSYPAHKHDEAGEHESALEEVYYFEIAGGPAGEPGIGFFRTSSSPGHAIDVCVEVADRDTVLVPFGWHGPASAAPGQDMYYLNVMAGPGPGRRWQISDHPDQAWVRASWATQQPDPRLLPKGQ